MKFGRSRRAVNAIMRQRSINVTHPGVRAACLIVLALAQARAAEPLVGTWRLTSQEVSGQEKNSAAPLTLRITQSGRALEFAYSVPVNNIYFVSMQYSSRLDGSEADVKDAQGTKIGTIKITRAAPSHYKMIMQGLNRPSASGTITVSPDGKTLTSESDTNLPGRGIVHTKQVFSAP
jgi:hypothetical protein